MMSTSPFVRENAERRDHKRLPNLSELSTDTLQHSKELNRLLTAAVVSHRFCSLLLNDPVQAIANGYNGETFELTREELQLLCAIKASSLGDFAMQLLTKEAAEKAWMDTKVIVLLSQIYAPA